MWVGLGLVGGAFPVMGGAYGCGRGSGLIVVSGFLYGCLVGGAWGLWAGLVMGGRGGWLCVWDFRLWVGLTVVGGAFIWLSGG